MSRKITKNEEELLESIEGFLQSYDMLMHDNALTISDMIKGVIKGYFIYEPEKARALIKKYRGGQ